MIVNINSSKSYVYDESGLIYKGAASMVYKAKDPMNNRTVCLKINPYGNLKGASALLKTEALALGNAGSATCRVPCLIEYWDDVKNKCFYTVMQYIPGESLRSKMKLMGRRDFMRCMCELCDILDAIHSRHIYHKDLKPENILITKEKNPYIIDFNISIATPNLTDGTEAYRAPEMKASGLSAARSHADIFSLGVMLYEYFTGSAPVNGKDYGTGLFTAPTGDWKYFTRPSEKGSGISENLDRAIAKAMERNPQKRYSKASELKRDLLNILKERPANGQA